jgi:hypothetical protein
MSQVESNHLMLALDYHHGSMSGKTRKKNATKQSSLQACMVEVGILIDI